MGTQVTPAQQAQVAGDGLRPGHDDTYNYDVFPAGTKKCAGPPRGGQVNYDNSIDINTNRLDAGQGLKGLPGSILQMTSNLQSVINPASLPVSAATCSRSTRTSTSR